MMLIFCILCKCFVLFIVSFKVKIIASLTALTRLLDYEIKNLNVVESKSGYSIV